MSSALYKFEVIAKELSARVQYHVFDWEQSSPKITQCMYQVLGIVMLMNEYVASDDTEENKVCFCHKAVASIEQVLLKLAKNGSKLEQEVSRNTLELIH